MEYEQFHRFTQRLPEATFLVTGDGRVLCANKSAEKLFGAQPQALSGCDLRDLIDDVENHLPQCLSVWRSSDELAQFSLLWRLANGASTDCVTQGFLLEDDADAAATIILLRCSPGEFSPGKVRLLNRQLDSQRKTLRRLRESREALASEQTKALVTLNSIRDAVITTDRSGNIEWLNPMAEALTGWSSDEALGRPLQAVFNIIDETSGELVVDSIARCLEEDRVIRLLGHTQLISRDGAEFIVEVSSTPLHTPDAAVSGAVIIFRDVTSAHLNRRQLEYLTQYDLLTGLFNRQHFEQQIEHVVHRARRSGDHHAVLFVDLDRFKQVNGCAGHQAGDELLVAVAERFQRRLRGGDILARLGGDQFGVLLNNVDQVKALRVGEAFRAALDNFCFHDGDAQYSVRASVGIAMIDSVAQGPDDIIKSADLACNMAKQEGGNRCRISGRGANNADTEMRLLTAIKDALAENAFELHFQPIVRTTDLCVTGYEVLLRLSDHGGPVLLPSMFMPVAERHGLMPAIDQWVLHKALSTMAESSEWDSGLELTVKLSRASLQDEGSVGFIRSAMHKFGVDPARLAVEIKERDLLADPERVIDVACEIQALGCRIVLDDFSAGLQVVDYLRRFPLDVLKVSGARLEGTLGDVFTQAAIASVTQLSRVLGKECIVAHVESASLLRQLAAMGVDRAQGYGVGRPVRQLAEAA